MAKSRNAKPEPEGAPHEPAASPPPPAPAVPAPAVPAPPPPAVAPPGVGPVASSAPAVPPVNPEVPNLAAYLAALGGADKLATRLTKAREATHGQGVEQQWKKGEEIVAFVHSLQPFGKDQSDRLTFDRLDPDNGMALLGTETRLAPTALSQDVTQRLAAGRRLFRIVYRGLMNGEAGKQRREYHAFTCQALA